MPENTSKLADLARKLERTELPRSRPGVDILPVSHDRFQARWSLSQEALAEGRNIASHNADETSLVLRAFELPADAHEDDLSRVWHDFHVDGIDSSAYFNLPGPTEKISAVVGLINKDGRFRPLARGQSIALPAPTPTPEPSTAGQVTPEPIINEPSTKRPQAIVSLNEAEICARLANIEGLPDAFKASAEESLTHVAVKATAAEPGAETIRHAVQSLPQTISLDEAAILDRVRHNMATDPEPTIEESHEKVIPQNELEAPSACCGASEQLASQWEDIWSEKAPIEIRAEFILNGKIGAEMKLLLGNEIIAPVAGGFFTWKRELKSFDQAWPLLQAGLRSPIVPAGPALEFFQNIAPSQRQLELHASLEIEGRVSDPDYIDRLPPELSPNREGYFKLSRMLPDGAVILPGLSLIADL